MWERWGSVYLCNAVGRRYAHCCAQAEYVPKLWTLRETLANLLPSPCAEYAELERQSADEHEILDILKFGSGADANRVLHLLRNGEDVASALRFAHHMLKPGPQSEGRFTFCRSPDLADDDIRFFPDARFTSVHSPTLDLDSSGDRLDASRRARTSERREHPFPRLPSFRSLAYVFQMFRRITRDYFR